MRVLLTRSHAESEAVAARLAILGFSPVIVPVVVIVTIPLTSVATRPSAILVTSLHATEALTPDDLVTFGDCPVLAVGAASAAAARAKGFVDVRVAGGDARALIDLLRLTHPGPARLLYLAGRDRKPDLETTLVGEGHRVETAETYEARPVPWTPETVDGLVNDPPGVCLHFSRRSAGLAIGQSRGRLDAVFDAAFHVCLSSDVAAPLRESGERRIVVAPQPNVDSLLQCLTTTISAKR